MFHSFGLMLHESIKHFQKHFGLTSCCAHRQEGKALDETNIQFFASTLSILEEEEFQLTPRTSSLEVVVVVGDSALHQTWSLKSSRGILSSKPIHGN